MKKQIFLFAIIILMFVVSISLVRADPSANSNQIIFSKKGSIVDGAFAIDFVTKLNDMIGNGDLVATTFDYFEDIEAEENDLFDLVISIFIYNRRAIIIAPEGMLLDNPTLIIISEFLIDNNISNKIISNNDLSDSLIKTAEGIEFDPLCGNGICEEGEDDKLSCPCPGSEPCYSCVPIKGTCPQDCTNEEDDLKCPKVPLKNCPEGTKTEIETDSNKCAIGYRCMRQLSNGRNAEVKIMPETASERAIERLGELNFTIELKEVGEGKRARAVYELTGNKQGRFLGIFKITARVQAQIDPETGEVVKTIKPWWSFLVAGV